MFARTIATIALGAVITMALMSGAGAMATAPSDGTDPLTDHNGGRTCALTPAFGSMPCPDLDWNIGGSSILKAKAINQRGE